MPSDQFDFVMPRARTTGCRSISPGLADCRQLIPKQIEVICGNCLNAINNGSASRLVSTASRALKFFCVLETILSCSETVLSTLNHCLLR